MRTVVRFSVTPVKSTRLSHPEEIRLERFGVAENRRFYVADPEGRMVSADGVGALLRVRATYDPVAEWLRMEFPDGLVVEGDASRTAGVPVTSDFFGRAVTGQVVDGDWSEAVTSFAGRPLVLVRPGPGDANDAAPVSLFSTASAEELARRSGSDRALDSRRFRMLVEVEGCDPHEEDAWIGRWVGLGEAVVEVTERVGRCVITTLDPDRGVKDFDSLKALVAYRGVVDDGINFGVYARVIEPGTIRVGDPVQPLAT